MRPSRCRLLCRLTTRCYRAGRQSDPVVTNPEFYRVIFENERVRVLEYLDRPGDETLPQRHPDSVMFTLTAFRRRLSGGPAAGGRSGDVELPEGVARWLPAQEHSGFNIGETATHTIFVELKEPAPATPAPGTPSTPEPLGTLGTLGTPEPLGPDTAEPRGPLPD